MRFFHIHIYNKPIASKYAGFETRRIIYECRCGKRTERSVYRNYYTDRVGFPIPTNHFITEIEFNNILNDL